LGGAANWQPTVGITATNGQLIDAQDTTYTDYRNSSRTVFEDSYYGSCFGLTNDRNFKVTSGKSMGSANMTNYATNLQLSTTNTERTLTLILYDNAFYFYIDSTFIEKIEVTSTKLQPTYATTSGKTYAYANGDGFLFGISAYNVATTTPITFSNIVEYYGDDAIAEIKKSYSAQITIPEETTEVSALADSLNGAFLGDRKVYA